MTQRKWLILTALAMEARAIAGEFRVKLEPLEEATLLPEQRAELRVIGIGGGRLKADWSEGFTGGIILAGLAGGIDPSLRIGDVVVDQPAGPWPLLPGRHGKILTMPRLVTTAEEKAELFRATGALAVDMESAAVQRYAGEAGLPLLTIRAISDGAEDSLPDGAMGWIDEFGRPMARRVAGGVIKNPLLIPALVRLGRRANLAAAAMGGMVRLAV